MLSVVCALLSRNSHTSTTVLLLYYVRVRFRVNAASRHTLHRLLTLLQSEHNCWAAAGGAAVAAANGGDCGGGSRTLPYCHQLLGRDPWCSRARPGKTLGLQLYWEGGRMPTSAERQKQRNGLSANRNSYDDSKQQQQARRATGGGARRSVTPWRLAVRQWLPRRRQMQSLCQWGQRVTFAISFPLV